MTVHETILEAAAVHRERPALIDGATGATVSYALLAERVHAVAGALAARGFAPGDRLALWAPNAPPWAGVALGAMRAGGAVSTIGPGATVREVAGALRTSRASLLVTVPPLAAAAREAAAELAEVVEIGPDVLGAPPGEAAAAAPGAPALLPFSSGTTGPPKAVVLTHANVLAAARQVQARIRLSERDVLLAVAPFAHVMGSVVTLAVPLAAGATVVTMPRFELEAFLALAARHRATMLAVPPPLMRILAHHPLVAAHDLSAVELIVAGGAAVAPDVQEAVAARFPHATVGQAYGMTETAVLITAPDRAEGTVPGSVGRPGDETEVRVHDGELLVRGPQVMAGYLGEPEQTAAAFDADGWLRTGDLAEIDPSGAIRIRDRLKELIKVSGHQVSPAELEAVLLEHPQVADAAVVGVPDEARGEAVVAVVVPRGELDEEALMAWFAERVAPYKRLRAVRTAETLPRTPVGKLLRRVLAEELGAVPV